MRRRAAGAVLVLLVVGVGACSPRMDHTPDRAAEEATTAPDVVEDVKETAGDNAPHWDGTRYVVDGDIGPDVYGWNCYVDNGGDCGANVMTAAGCVSDPVGYTMCTDGRVYVLQADGSKTDTVWRDR